jgi:predicted transcriptional regulator
VSVVEVLAPGQQSLGELATTINREHALAVQAAQSMLSHGLKAGDALNAAKVQMPHGSWLPWLEENTNVSRPTAQTYMRCAYYRDQLEAAGIIGVKTADRFLRGFPAIPRSGSWVRAEIALEARRLHRAETSPSDIAEILGISRNSVYRYINPAYEARVRTASRNWHRRQAAAQKALAAQERERTIKRAVLSAPKEAQRVYAASEKLQDDLGAAHAAATDSEARAALSRAGEHYRKMRDEIVRALGVT